MNKKKLLIIVIIIIILFILITIFFILRKRKETIKIGAIISITGTGYYSGEAVRDSMVLAVDEINTRGGINGKKIKLIIEDGKTNTKESIKAFKRIEEKHHPLLYISTLSSVSMSLAPLAESNEVVLVGLVATASQLMEQREWIFRYWTIPEFEVKPILLILHELKVKRLGILYLNDEYGNSNFEMIQKEFNRDDKIVKSESFELNVSNFSEKIMKLKDMEAIYAVGFTTHLSLIFKQLK